MDIYDLPKWEEFQSKIVEIVDRQDENKVRFKSYAQTYARHIIVNLHEGIAMGVGAEDATKAQVLYVLSNMEGALEEDLREVQKLSADKGIDVSSIIDEILNGEEDGQGL